MPRRRLLLASVVLLLSAGALWFTARRAPSGVTGAPLDSHAAATTERTPEPADARAVAPVVEERTRPRIATAPELRALTYAQAWNEAQPAAFSEFRAWVARYQSTASNAERERLTAEGVGLAQARRAALRTLMENDPRAALSLAVPAAVRVALPAAVHAELEQRFSTRGDYTVLAVDYTAAELARRRQLGLNTDPFEHSIKIGDAEYRAYVYGRRIGETTKGSVPLHGILVEGVAAVHESALRVLEADEAAAEAIPAAWRAELAGRIIGFSTVDELLGGERRLEAGERGLGPDAQPIPPEEARGLPTLPGGVAGTPPLEAPATAWTIGAKNILVIRVDFSDLPGEPRRSSTIYTQAYIQNLSDTQIAPYYAQSSYGQTSLVTTVTSGTYRMPQTAAFYATNGANTQLHSDARTAASGAYNVNAFDRILVLFSTLGGISGSSITYGGLAQVGGKNSWINGEYDFRVVSHELGHTYGLYHANVWTITDGNPLSGSGVSTEYGDDFDTMGANFANDQRTDFNPWFKNLLGWATDAQIRNVTSTGTYRLNRLDNSTGTGTLGLSFGRDGTRNYWVGVRRKFTTNTSMQHGAYVVWGYNTNQQSNLLDLNTPGSGVADAALTAGSTLLDTVGNVSIRNVAEGGTAPDEYLDVEVKVGLNGLPVFDTQPQSQGFAIGGTVTLAVAVSGTAPISLQWRKNGNDLAGATNATLVITNAQLGDAGVYTVRAINSVATVLSSAATLAVNAAPVFVVQPQNITTAANQSVTLSVTVNASPAPTYQWRKGGAPISGATAATLTLSSITTASAGTYDVQATNTFGTVPSASAVVTVNAATTPPSNDNFANAWVLPGGSGLAIGTNVGATGESGEPTHVLSNGTATSVWYKWTPSVSGTAQVDTIGSALDTVLAVYTGSVLTSLTKVGEDDQSGGLNTSKLLFPVTAGVTYSIAVGDWSSARLGGGITLHYGVYVAPSITTQPASQIAAVGGAAVFTVAASGTSPSYQWFHAGLPVAGGTGATLALTNLQTVDAGAYYVVLSNLAGSVTSNTVTLSGSNAAPTITTSPGNLTVTSGQPGSLSVAATSSGAISYQWRRNGFLIGGATNAQYALASASRSDADYYDVIVASGLSATVSSVARLSVGPTAYPGLVAPDPAWELRPEAPAGLGYVVVPLADGRAYLAGSFVGFNGASRKGVVRINVDGTVDSAFASPEIDNTVRALAVQADGKVVVAGDFARVGGLFRQRLARLNVDGTLDRTFDIGTAANGSMLALALQSDGKIIAGGSFTAYAGSLRNFLVRLNADGTLDTGYLNRGTLGTVNAVALQSDGRLLIGGSFTSVLDNNGSSLSRTRLARINTDGAFDTYNPAPTGTVNTIAVQGDGKVLIGGLFSGVAATTVGNIARLNADGSSDPAFNTNVATGFNSTVNAVAVQADGKVLVGGFFSAYATTTLNFFARLNADGTRDTSLQTTGFNSSVLSVAALSTGRLLVGGAFTYYYNAASSLTARSTFARLNSDGSLDSGVNFAVTGPGSIYGIIPLAGGKVLVTGFFTSLRGATVPVGVARILPDGSVDPSFNSGGFGANSTVYAAAVQPDGKIVIAGFFSAYNSTTANRVARLNPDGTLDSSFNIGTGLGSSTWGYTLAILPGGRILVGGDFTSVSGVTRNRVVVLTATGALDSSFDPGIGANSTVYTSAVQPDGKILIGGSFTTYNGTTASRIARLNPTGSLDTSFNTGTGASSSVYTVAIQPDGRVLIGGFFSSYSGTSRSGVARLQSSGALDTSFTPPTVAPVYSLLPLENGQVTIRGSFVLAASGATPSTAFLARLNADGSRDTAFAAGGFSSSSNPPTLLGMGDAGQLYMQSSGTTGMSATNSTTAPTITTQPVAQTLPPGATLALSVVAGSDLPLSYQWQFNGSPIAGATTSSYTLLNAQPANAGNYNVVITSELGSTTSATVAVAVGEARGLLSGAIRTDGGTGSAALTGLFTIEGSSPKQFLIRVLGPTLASFGVSGVMADPQLSIVNATTGVVAASNDDWGTAANVAAVTSVSAQLGAISLNANSKDAAILATFSPGTYRARVNGANNTTGTAMLEIYDADTLLRLVYVGARATAGSGAGALIQGFQIGPPPAGRSYLIRALGPSLNIPGALADPQLSLYAGSTLLASNDNWGGDSNLAALASSVGAMPLSPASKDAALSFSPTAAGTFTVQVASTVTGASGLVLLEIYEVDSSRAATLTPAVLSSPEPVTVTAGGAATFGAVVAGKPTPAFQWRKNGAAISAATTSALTLPVVQTTDAGSYDVVATNSAGSATSATAALVVNSPSADSATHSIATGYVAGGTVTVTNMLTYTGSPSSLGWLVNIPAGWTFVSDSGNAGDVKPSVGQTGTLEWAWTNPANTPNPAIFTYTLSVPATENVDRAITASAIVRASGAVDNVTVMPNPLAIPLVTNHSADTDKNFRISLLELTRVIELYNTRNGSSRTGCYAVATVTTEDGFQADPTRSSSAVVSLVNYHSADSNHDGKLSLLELTRIIELYNYRSGSSRTGQYHVQTNPPTEDGFAPGP